MTATAAATLKARFQEYDRKEFVDDLVDTIINPQDAMTVASTLAVQGHLTMSNTKNILPATAGGSTLGSTSAEWGSVYLSDSKGVYFGADQDASVVHDGTKGIDVSVADNDSAALDIKQGTNSYIKVVTTNNGESVDIGKPLAPQLGIDRSAYTEFWDDFLLYQAGFTEADKPWILNSGSNSTAVDPAINAQENGVIQLVTGNADGTTAADGSQMVGAVPFQADSGGLVFETRLHINTAVTTVSVCAGLTDATGLEEPFNMASGNVGTATATDGVAFLFDTDATTDGWFAMAADGGTLDTGYGTCAVAPTANTYQTLRIEVSEGGGTCNFFINGSLVRTLAGGGVSPDVNLYPTVIACATTTQSRSVDVDYVYVGANRG